MSGWTPSAGMFSAGRRGTKRGTRSPLCTSPLPRHYVDCFCGGRWQVCRDTSRASAPDSTPDGTRPSSCGLLGRRARPGCTSEAASEGKDTFSSGEWAGMGGAGRGRHAASEPRHHHCGRATESDSVCTLWGRGDVPAFQVEPQEAPAGPAFASPAPCSGCVESELVQVWPLENWVGRNGSARS